ncbi:phytoene desaturase family protein [Candidatus Uabimicrobium amorphum]|uniref:Phytoene dehydrogenase n=1 Tax=Uabimicrobium amorphum TaxID=2596890 RepID=A0A5S9IHQ9_UABAM|nr:NAD(P)/FAD-dependent oxidoreductase [Candidatus Uabimicrobium amorphum]BBM82003.1 phytoene dehydrogenase [Candidatus Uabimicrobium amorphum]
MSEKTFGKELPEKKWDCIIVGSGMGGMTCAAMLSKLGKKVLLVEQHYVPGGYTHTFPRKNWRWDVGVHAVGEVTKHSMVGRVLSRLTDDRLQWASLGEAYDEFHFPDEFRIDFPDTPQKFRENLLHAFPEEQKAIDEYLKQVKTVAKNMRNYYLSKGLPGIFSRFLGKNAQQFFLQKTQQVLDSLTDNKRLKTIIASQWGYYGSPPSRSSFAMQALVAKHFSYGGYYPVGGSQQIATELLQTVANSGGWTKICTGVSQIIVEKKRAVGVVLEDGRKVYAPKIVSAIGAIETVNHLLPQEMDNHAWVKSIQTLKPSAAHVCLYLGFKGDIRQAGASPANKWFWETWDCEFESWDFRDPRALAPVLYTSFPSLKDPQHDPGKQMFHTGEVVTFVPFAEFAKWQNERVMKRGDDYNALKEELSDRLKKQLFKYMPQLEPLVAYSELSTPVSCTHYTRAAKGAIYGIEPTPQRYANPWLKPRTPLKNFYLSGSDVSTVGVIGAMVGGVLTALAVEPWKTMAFIRRN